MLLAFFLFLFETFDGPSSRGVTTPSPIETQAMIETLERCSKGGILSDPLATFVFGVGVGLFFSLVVIIGKKTKPN